MTKRRELLGIDGQVEDDTQEQGNQQQILVRAKELRNQAEELWWEFGKTLHEIYEKAIYLIDGYETWVSYVEQALDISYSSAQKFVATHKWLAGFDPDFQAWAHSLGSSKARLLTNRFQPDDAHVWRNRLAGKTCREIEALVKGQDPQAHESPQALNGASVEGATYGADGYGDGFASPMSAIAQEAHEGGPVINLKPGELTYGEPERPEVIHFSLYPAQRQNVQTAIDRAKQTATTDRDGHALDLICTSFLAGDGCFDGTDAYLTSVERTLGVRLIALNRAGQVTFGHETLDLICDQS